VDESVGQLTALTHLDLAHNKLVVERGSLGNLTALTLLNLWANKLVEPPSGLDKLRRLSYLVLSGNELLAVPDSVGKLTHLTYLDLSRNKLVMVPESLGKLRRLTELDMSDNQLIAVPRSLGKLRRLTRLNLSHNRLTTVPESVDNLTDLEVLDLSHNQLIAVPESLGNLTKLGVLDLNDNPLKGLPPRLALRAGALLVTGRLAVLPEESDTWPGQFLDRAWMGLRSLFVPSVSLAAVLAVPHTAERAAAVLQLYSWERDRLMTLAKGSAGAAITVLTALIATAVEGKVATGPGVLYLAAALVAGLLLWGGFLLTGLRRLAEEYSIALDITK
jgi:hypothetical protein